MGQLKSNKTGPSIWPTQVKTIVKHARNACTNENDACMALVQDRLHGFNARIQKYRTELDTLKNRLQDDRKTICQTIEAFVQEKLENLRRKIHHKITLVHYDYKDRALELEFLHQKPSESCVRLYR